MKKKKEETIEETMKDIKDGVFDLKIEDKPKIGKLEIVYNNEELNKLRDKVNEIIDNL